MNKKSPLYEKEWEVTSPTGCNNCHKKTKLTLHTLTMQALCKECKPYFEDSQIIIR